MYLLLFCEGWNYSNSTGRRSNRENLPEKFQNWTKIILAPVNVPGTSRARSAREGETDGTIHIGTVDFAESTVIVCDAFWRNVLQRQKKDSRLCYFFGMCVAWHPKTAAKETNIVSVSAFIFFIFEENCYGNFEVIVVSKGKQLREIGILLVVLSTAFCSSIRTTIVRLKTLIPA